MKKLVEYLKELQSCSKLWEEEINEKNNSHSEQLYKLVKICRQLRI